MSQDVKSAEREKKISIAIKSGPVIKSHQLSCCTFIAHRIHLRSEIWYCKLQSLVSTNQKQECGRITKILELPALISTPLRTLSSECLSKHWTFFTSRFTVAGSTVASTVMTTPFQSTGAETTVNVERRSISWTCTKLLQLHDSLLKFSGTRTHISLSYYIGWC